jgi:hypothetical protein
VEALDFAVGAGPVRLRFEMPDRVCGEELAERAVVDVAEGIVGHDSFRLDPARSEEGQGALDESWDGDRFLVRKQLGVAEAAAVVDDRVRLVVAGREAAVEGGLAAVAGGGVAGLAEAGVVGDVHVQQITGTRPFVTVGGLPRRP